MPSPELEVSLEALRAANRVGQLRLKPSRKRPDPWLAFLRDADLLGLGLGVGKPIRELPFHPTRKWRFDAAFPSVKVGIEREGGTWVQGRHTRGAGYARDAEKYNEAGILGWLVIRFTTDMIASKRRRAQALDTLTRALRSRA